MVEGGFGDRFDMWWELESGVQNNIQVANIWRWWNEEYIHIKAMISHFQDDGLETTTDSSILLLFNLTKLVDIQILMFPRTW